MNSLVPAVVMSISYSHDIASALLAICGVAMWLIAANYPAEASPETEQYFIRIYHGISRMAKDSLIWIVVAGVPRIYFYTEYEWSTAAGDLQLVAVVIKHIVIFLIVGSGVYFWSRLGKKVRQLKVLHAG